MAWHERTCSLSEHKVYGYDQFGGTEKFRLNHVQKSDLIFRRNYTSTSTWVDFWAVVYHSVHVLSIYLDKASSSRSWGSLIRAFQNYTTPSLVTLDKHTCYVTLDISGSSIDQWASGNIQGNLSGMDRGTRMDHVIISGAHFTKDLWAHN